MNQINLMYYIIHGKWNFDLDKTVKYFGGNKNN